MKFRNVQIATWRAIKSAFQIMDLRYPDIRILELNYPDFIDNELSGYYPDWINPDSITNGMF